LDLAVVIRGVTNTTQEKIAESIRASGNSVTSTETDSKMPRPVLQAELRHDKHRCDYDNVADSKGQLDGAISRMAPALLHIEHLKA
jgi:hypothetical protein